jgi:hypothetical protein
MAFRFINPVATGQFRYILSRAVEDVTIIDLTDTPSNGVTGFHLEVVTGSTKSIELDGIGEYMKLPTAEGNNTEFGLDDIGVNGPIANNLIFESWVKLSDIAYTAGYANQYWEATIQRDTTSGPYGQDENGDDIFGTTTEGFDGIYHSRLLYIDPEGDTTSAHYVDFQFTSGTNIAYSLTSNSSIPVNTWTHLMTRYTWEGDTYGSGEGNSTMAVYINGVLDRVETLDNLHAAGALSNPAYPSTGSPLDAKGLILFNGKVDEMRLWCLSASDPVMAELASVTSIGLYPEKLSTATQNDLSPSANTLVGWWRFEDVTAVNLYASIVDSIEDSTEYNHNATPVGFEGPTSFSDDQHSIYGSNAMDNFPDLKIGTTDNGGMLTIDNRNSSILLEEGWENLVLKSENSWTPILEQNGDPTAIVNVDERQIYTGTSGVRVNTGYEGGGAIHTIDYSPENFIDKNKYICGLRMIAASGSVSARVTFTLGPQSNSASVTAVMTNLEWRPFFVRNTAINDPGHPSSITGSVKVEQLHNPAEAADEGSLFNVDSFMIKQGDYPSAFVGQEEVRKTGQIYWNIGD